MDHHDPQAEHFGYVANGERVPTLTDSSEEALLHKLCADCHISFEKSLDVRQWIDENWGDLKPPDEAASRRHSEIETRFGLEKVFRLMLGAGNSRAAVLMMAYALGFDDLLGNRTPAAMAREMDMSRYNLIKLLNRFQEELNLPLRGGQKEPAAREKMSAMRKAQLEKI